MSSPATVVDEFVASFNAHDEARIREGYSETVEFVAPGAEVEGAEAAAAYAMVFIKAFPDVRLEVTNVIDGGEWIVAEFAYSGTHTGPLATPDGGEIPPTNRSVQGKGVDLLRLEGDKVAAEHLYFDQLEFMTQLGLVPEA